MTTEKELIDFYNLSEHPEGGFYKQVYRSEGEISEKNLSKEFNGNRNFATSIYFLLTSKKFSAFHKINQDEIWHFYLGSPLKIHMISPEGIYKNVIVGSDFKSNNHFQYTVPAQYYFAAEVLDANSYSFVGCSVSPGFDFRDFQLPNCKDLCNEFPEYLKIIERLTHH